MAHRVAPGNFPDGNAGLRVSKPGYDALMNPVDDAYMMFNSDWASCLPIHFMALNVGIGNGATAFAYDDLGYLPFSAYCWFNSIYGSTVWFPMIGCGGGASSTAGVSGSAMATFDSWGTNGFLSVEAQSNQVVINMLGSVVQRISLLVFKVQAA